MIHHAKDCLKSVVKNTSGYTRTFGFLPPHGVTLTADEEYEVFGNILDALGSGRSRYAQRRAHAAFQDAIDRGDIALVSTPNPILNDTVNTTSSKMINLTSGSLAVAAPCWATTDADDSEVAA